jgi:beta-fructofuranosidase
MYAGAGHSDWEIGDVDVFIEDGVYHLFHLIIPNHDYIAHAVSRDGMTWRRVDNALFVGHPGSWDDDMLWTMHVSRGRGRYEMLYTGLRRRDRGTRNAIGLAVSDDLMTWRKVDEPGWPLSPDGTHYETLDQCERGWTSFRDPFHFGHEGDEYMLFCARATEGPVSRRGCVGIARRGDSGYELLPPLHYPRVYDDVECPCVLRLGERTYLVGSIREDVKVRYWIADSLFDEYRSFHSDILLPAGNYAARIVRDGDHWLLYTFYYADRLINSFRVLPPPKELATDERGRLVLRSFYRWNEKVSVMIGQPDLPRPRGLLENPTAEATVEADSWMLGCRSGYEIFAIEKPAENVIWEGILTLEGLGKCGLVMDCDEQCNGYFIPFDFVGGLVRIRRWGFNPHDNRNNFVFDNLQSSLFRRNPEHTIHFRLLRYGNYIELSIDGVVKLTLMDHVFEGSYMGIYSSSSVVSLRDSRVHVLESPDDEYPDQMPALGEG